MTHLFKIMYRLSNVKKIRPVKGFVGRTVDIDLGKVFDQPIEAYMNRSQGGKDSYKLEIINNRIVRIPATLTKPEKDFTGKWYFEVKLLLSDTEKKTIYRGTIRLYDSITR